MDSWAKLHRKGRKFQWFTLRKRCPLQTGYAGVLRMICMHETGIIEMLEIPKHEFRIAEVRLKSDEATEARTGDGKFRA